MRTTQELFDTAVEAILRQGKQSLDKNYEYCQYRGLHGNKCVVGHLIPDEVYTPDMEGNAFPMLWNQFPAIQELFPKGETFNDAYELAKRLQDVHDNLKVASWKTNFCKIAVDFHLEWKFQDLKFGEKATQ